MQDSSGHELVVRLSSLLRLHGDLILKEQSKLCLTATSLEFLNHCFGHLRSEQPASQLSGVTDLVPNDVIFLLDFVGKTPSLKLVQGTCLTFDGLVNISCFRALQVLEIKKVPAHLIRGFQSLRPQLKTFICNRSLNSLSDVLFRCGGDHLTAPFSWPQLENGDFSYNGIEQLDDSLKLLPVLRTLNLSHNKIKCVENEPYWQYLSGVRHVNVGFNQLDCIPVIPVGVGIIAFQMTTLIIRNNNLQNLKGLQAFSNLHTLDASFNCIMSFSELTPLAHLHNLTLLYLQGNPVVFYPDYRIITTTCLYPVPRHEAIKIDGKPLDPVEEIYLGRNVHPVSLLSYIPERSLPHPRLKQVRKDEELNESNSSESQESPSPRSSPSRRQKRKNKKGRRPVAREIDFDDEDEPTTTTEDMTVTSTPVENILEFADDVEQLKKLREMGGETWLPAIDTMVHNEESASSPGKCQPGQGSSVFRTESLQSVQSFSDDRLEINSHSSSLSVITLVDEAWLPAIDTMVHNEESASSPSKCQPGQDVTDEHHFLVTLVQTDDEEKSAVPVLVAITDDFIVEKNYAGKVICQLETCLVKDVKVDWTADAIHPVIHVFFDYISRERQARHYKMESQESALQLANFLKPFVTSHPQPIVAAVEHLQCLKCSAEFSRPQTSGDQMCPDCGSTMTVFSVNEADKLASALNNCSIKTVDSEMSVAVLVSFSSSSPSAEAVNNSADEDRGLDFRDNDAAVEQDHKVCVQDEADISQAPDVIANTQKEPKPISTVPDLFSNTSNKHPEKNLDSSSLNNVKQKRYEVKNQERFVVKDERGVFVTRKAGNLVVKSALSNSLRDAPTLEQLKKQLGSHSLPSGADVEAHSRHQDWTGRTVQDFANDSLSTSQRNSHGLASGAEYLSQSLPSYNRSGILKESVAASARKLSVQRPTDSAMNMSGGTTKRSAQLEQSSGASSSNLTSDGVTLQSTNQVISSSASSTPMVFFQNLFNRLSGKVSGNSSASSDSPVHSNFSSCASTPTVMDNVALSFRLSPDEFSSCDHRLKLFFEVSLFEVGINETFCCLLKAPVVPYGSTVETPAVLITSNKMLYICRFTLRGSGTPDECLTKLVSHPLDELQYVDQGLGFQSFRLEFSTGKSCYDFYVRDKDRCQRFLKLFIDFAQQAKVRIGGGSVTVTPPNPQTLQHIRSWVFGVRNEDPVSMCQRIHQQAIHFTDPPLIKDRKSLLRSYSSCIVGKDFVSWMVRTREAESREEAVCIGQRLLDAGGLEHVSKEQHFEDKDQYYRFSAPERKLETSDYPGGDLEKELAEDSLPVLDTSIVFFIMAHRCTNTKRLHYNLSAVSVVVSRTHIALAYQNPQWPVPRYADPPVHLEEPPFVCLVKHKITDITSLDFYEDNPCFMGISITDEDAPRETAESQWILRTETFTTLSSLVKAIRKPWESQFGVELQKNLHPSITEDKAFE